MKTPKPRRLPSGSWFIQLRLGGRSVSITEPTEKACVQKAQLIKAEHIAGKDTRSMDRSLNTLDKLLQNYINAKKPVLSPSTVRGYEAIRRTRFLAYKDRDPEKINWQRLVSDESRLCGPKTLKNAWALVAAAVQFCGQDKPAVTLPQVVSDEHPYLEAEQIPAFLDAIRGKPCELAALLGLHGLRRSEMFAITWADIDLPQETPCSGAQCAPPSANKARHSEQREESAAPASLGFLHVRGSMVHDEDGKLIRKKENKNRSSRRTVPIMIPRLAELLSAAPPGDKSSPVLTGHPNSVYKSINLTCERAGLPLIGVHGLRHSFASLAHSLGVPEAECMALGGWNDPQTMRKIYTHLDTAARLKAANAMTAFYQNANAKR